MPSVRPFTGIRYDVAAVGDLAAVVAPPYDVISPEEEERLRARSPMNVVHLDLPREDGAGDRYEAAGRRFAEWLSRGVLVRDAEPCLYVYEQRFELHGTAHVVHGVMAAVGLEPLGSGILPHEETLVGPKEDRLSLMRGTSANLSPIYGIYSDPSRTQTRLVEPVLSEDPLLEVADDNGVTHSLWSTSDPGFATRLADVLSEHPIFIADGHHRYKTALIYQDERRSAEGTTEGDPHRPYDFILMLLVNVDDRELVTLPVHRLVRNVEGGVPAALGRLRQGFDVVDLPAGAASEVSSRLMASAPGTATFGVYAGTQHPGCLLGLKAEADPADLISDPHSEEWKRLDVTVLHRLVIEKGLGIERANVENQRDVAFVKSAEEASRRVDSGEFELALLMAPTPASAVQTIARLGEMMPQKSTYFYPKPLTGLVINPLD